MLYSWFRAFTLRLSIDGKNNFPSVSPISYIYTMLKMKKCESVSHSFVSNFL